MTTFEQRLITAARRDQEAQEAARQAREHLQSVACAAVQNGMSEYQAADAAGVTRQAIRNWQGK